MADGSIRINTKLETKEAQADLVKLEKECEKTAQKIGAAGEKMKAVFTGMSTSQLETAFRRVNKELDKTNAEIAELDSKIGVVQADTDKMLPMATTDEQAANLLAIEEMQIGDLVQKRAALNAKAAEYKSQLQTITGEIDRQKAKQDEQKNKVDQTKAKTKQLGNAGKEAGNKTSAAMKKASRSANTFGTAIKKGIKSLGKMALACVGVRAAYNAIRRAASSYIEDNQELSQQISSLWSVAGQAIGPFIEVMVKGITTVVSWVNTLIKALTGVDLVAKANAAALKKQASATKDAAKAAQLAGFDEMNKLTDDTSSSSSDTGAAVFDSSFGFEIPDFLEEMKKKILEGDWYGAGATLGQALMDGIENLDWNKLGETVGEIFISAVQFAFGLVLNLDIGTVITGVNKFSTGLFNALSKGIQEMNWQEIGAGIIRLLISPFSAKGFTDLTKAASGLIGSIVGALAAAVVGAAKEIAKVATNIWKGIKNAFKDVNWGGTPGEIINGLWEGIKKALKNVGKWVNDNIWVPFRDGFKKAFGIASPSKKMKEMGGYLIDGLKEGIGNVWTKIKSKFDDAKAKLSGWGSTIKTTAKDAGTKFVSGLKTGLDTLKTKLKEPINALIGMIENALNWIIGKMNTLSWSVPKWVPGIGGKTFGFNLKQVSIPRLAQGGIVNNPGRGVLATIGEAGAEAVLPLENNTGWMDILADKINAGVQKIVVPIYLNGRKIAEEVIDINSKRNFATNGAW